MNCYLYGIIEFNEERTFGPIGFEMPNQQKTSVMALPFEDLAVVVGPTPHEHFDGLRKEILIQSLLSHQQTLETIMKVRFVLPFKFGTVLKDKKEMSTLLSQNHPFLLEWFHKMKNRCEMEVVATWDTQTVLKEMAERDPQIAEWKKNFQALSGPEQEKEKLSLGKYLSEKLKKQAARCAEEILTALKGLSESWATHELMNDQMVFNASFLLTRGGEELFSKTLEDLDKRLEGKLNFRCVGPLPPYSFATVTIKRFDPKQIHQAQEKLGLKSFVDPGQVKKAYKKMASQCHPDTHPKADGKEFESLQQAYELLTSYCKGGCKPIRVSLSSISGETL